MLKLELPKMNDFMASIVVFLVALPLCLGIAIASGLPPAAGLITGIVGGLVVGFFAGSPLQVSGPAAGLSVMIWQAVETYGASSLGLIVLIAGLLQILAAVAKFGQWFRAVSPALIRGVLAGIGALIVFSQIHVMLDMSPVGSGINNLLAIPDQILKLINSSEGSHQSAFLIGALVISTIVLWDKFKPKSLKSVPGPLVGVLFAILITSALSLSVKMVQVPTSLIDAVQWLNFSTFFDQISWGLLGTATAIGVVASAETLLCSTATDQMHKGERTKYNKELFAQGIGNSLCGILGALPMTGVIVRSTANIQAGAETRWSSIFHGLWLLIFVVALPHILGLISTAALAAILVLTGYKLLDLAQVKRFWKNDRWECAVFVVTFLSILSFDLLTVVLIGFALSLFKTTVQRVKLDIEKSEQKDLVEIKLSGAASFLNIPKLAAAVDEVPLDRNLIIDISGLEYMDFACRNMVESRVKLTSRTVISNEVRGLTQSAENGGLV